MHTEEQIDTIINKGDFKMFVIKEELERFDNDYTFYRMHYNAIKDPKEYAEKLNSLNEKIQLNIMNLKSKLKKWTEIYSDKFLHNNFKEKQENLDKETAFLLRKMIIFSS